MHLRPSLEPREPDRETTQALQALLTRLTGAGSVDAQTRADLQTFQTRSGTSRTLDDFRSLRAGGEEALWAEIQYGLPPRVPDLKPAELAELVARALAAFNQPARFHWYAKAIDRNVAMPQASDLFFFPPSDLAVSTVDYEPDPDDIVARILAYQPLDP